MVRWDPPSFRRWIPAAAVGQVCGKAWHGGGQCELWRRHLEGRDVWMVRGVVRAAWHMEEIDKHAINTKKMMGHSQKQKQMYQGLPWLFQISHMALRTSRPQFSVYWAAEDFSFMKWMDSTILYKQYRSEQTIELRNWCQRIRVDKAGSCVYLFGEPRLWVVTGRITGGFQS